MGEEIVKMMGSAGSFFGGGDAAGVASTAGDAAKGGSFFTKGNALSALQGGFSVASLLSKQKATGLKEQQLRDAAFESLQDIETVKSETLNRAGTLKKSLLDAWGERDVAYAAGGVDLGFGTPAQARQEAANATERALTLDQQEQDFKIERLQTRAQRYFKAAKNTKQAGLLEAFGGIGESLTKINTRGFSETPKTT